MKNLLPYLIVFLYFQLPLVKCFNRFSFKTNNNNVCTTSTCSIEAANFREKIDESVDPCDNFYNFACGNFVKTTKIPDDKVSVSQFSILDDLLQQQLKEILNKSENVDDIGPVLNSKKFFAACLNEELIENKRLSPVMTTLESMGGWPILQGAECEILCWRKVLLQMQLSGFDTSQLFSIYISPDSKNSSSNVIYIDQASPNIEREYLIEGVSNEIVEAYYRFHVDTAVYFGADPTQAEFEAKNVLNFEIEMAKLLIPKEERRDAKLLYNPMTLAEFQKLYPILNWLEYFRQIFPENIAFTEDEIIVVTDFIRILQKVQSLIANTPNRVIVNYQIWSTVRSVTSFLNEDIRNLRLEFLKVYTGQQRYEERWKVCVRKVLDNLPIATSSLYVKNFFKKESKETASELVSFIRNEFNNILKNVTWMDNSTKTAALDKSKKMEAFIGYPDELVDDSKLTEYYGNLTLDETKFLESFIAIRKFDQRKFLESLRKPINKSNWETHADVAIVNAFYNPVENSITFPAGILQGIFFNPDRPSYLNYGSIGFVIGHEITHGFDDEGRQYDGNGNVNDWWAKETESAFLEKAQCIIDQYGNYKEPTVDTNLNGINTQGENIADNGGIKEAYLAYQKFVEKNGPEMKLPGLDFTPNQLFWLSAAQTWCSVYRPEFLKQLIISDVHSTAMFRVIGPLSNMPEFSRDFQCSNFTAMNPKHKCEIW